MEGVAVVDQVPLMGPRRRVTGGSWGSGGNTTAYGWPVVIICSSQRLVQCRLGNLATIFRGIGTRPVVQPQAERPGDQLGDGDVKGVALGVLLTTAPSVMNDRSE